MTPNFNLNIIDSTWRSCIEHALKKLDPYYIQHLLASNDWLPGKENIFNAFSMPVNEVKYVLFGESPYPRAQSANGYAFWDQAVTDIWSATGLSKPVNRATSLRNIVKMLLITDGALTEGHTTQEDIAKLDKSHYVQTNEQLFKNFIDHGILLLNATPVLQPLQVRKDARAWKPFLKEVLDFLVENNPSVEFLLFGNIANEIDTLITKPGLNKLYAEHPYNISFINNPDILAFFQPLHLLAR